MTATAHSRSMTRDSAAQPRLPDWPAASLVIAQALSILVPVIVLGAAIDWPASLDDPASVALPRLLDNLATVRFGYLVYLAHSVLFAPAIVLLARRASRLANTSAWVDIAVGAAFVSALARSIGISRWLVTMKELADDSAAGQAAALTSGLFKTTDNFGATIGEALGVSLFGGLAIGSVAALMILNGHRRLGVVGVVVALAVATQAGDLVGIDTGILLSVIGPFQAFWMVAAGYFVLARRGADAR